MALFTVEFDRLLNTKPSINNVIIKTWNRNIMPFTITNFTTDAGFSDPDGDGFGKVMIMSLPSQGQLVYGNANDPVTIGQEFTSTEISNGVLKYYCEDYHGATSGVFNFAVADDNINGPLYSDTRMFTIDVGEISSFGSATSSNDDLYCSTPGDYIYSNFNERQLSYRAFNFGVLRALDPYSTSPIYNGLPADKIVIESYEQDLIVQDSFSPWNPANVIPWSGALPSQIRHRDLLDASDNVITLPYEIPLPGNNAGILNIGPKVFFEVEYDMYVPATINYPANSSHDFAFRRIIIGYKIYSGGVAQTRTLYFMWYTGTVS